MQLFEINVVKPSKSTVTIKYTIARQITRNSRYYINVAKES